MKTVAEATLRIDLAITVILTEMVRCFRDKPCSTRRSNKFGSAKPSCCWGAGQYHTTPRKRGEQFRYGLMVSSCGL